MMKIISLYYETVIKPIEKERDKLLKETSKKSTFGFLFDNQNKKPIQNLSKGVNMV